MGRGGLPTSTQIKFNFIFWQVIVFQLEINLSIGRLLLAYQSRWDVHWFAKVSITEFTPLSPPCSPWIGNGGELAPVTLETVVGEQGPAVGEPHHSPQRRPSRCRFALVLVLPRTLPSRPCLNWASDEAFKELLCNYYSADRDIVVQGLLYD
jgi:hypothetical protein